MLAGIIKDMHPLSCPFPPPGSGAFVFQSYWLGFCEAGDKKIYREATEVRAEIYAHSA